jgi:hypothetical protein
VGQFEKDGLRLNGSQAIRIFGKGEESRFSLLCYVPVKRFAKGLTATRHASRNPSGEEADWLPSRWKLNRNTTFGASNIGHQSRRAGQPENSAKLQTLTNPQ